MVVLESGLFTSRHGCVDSIRFVEIGCICDETWDCCGELATSHCKP